MLFDIPDTSKVNISFPIIRKNYSILYDAEFPMLYTGSNDMGNNIVGSLICEDDENEVLRYIHSVVSPTDLGLFLNKKLSYRDLLEKQESIFVVDKNHYLDVIDTFHISFKSIPQDYLPSPLFHCPDIETVYGSNFSWDLKGMIADAQEAYASEASIVSNTINEIFSTIIEGARSIGAIPQVRQLAYAPRSFGINFRVKVKSPDIYFNEKAFMKYISNAIDYSLNHLSEDIISMKDDKLDSENFETLITKSLEIVYNSLGKEYDQAAKEQTLKSILKIPFELQKITDQIGEGFNSIIVNSLDEEKSSTLGVLDASFSAQLLLATTELIEKKSENFEMDLHVREYKIHVYHLNKESRKGNAHFDRYIGEDTIVDNPRIIITGETNLENSIFMESMSTGKKITIDAIGKKVNGRLRELHINF